MNYYKHREELGRLLRGKIGLYAISRYKPGQPGGEYNIKFGMSWGQKGIFTRLKKGYQGCWPTSSGVPDEDLEFYIWRLMTFNSVQATKDAERVIIQKVNKNQGLTVNFRKPKQTEKRIHNEWIYCSIAFIDRMFTQIRTQFARNWLMDMSFDETKHWSEYKMITKEPRGRLQRSFAGWGRKRVDGIRLNTRAWDTPVGTGVRKWFPETKKYYNGKVTALYLGMDGKLLYHIVYEDGDEEDVDAAELNKITTAIYLWEDMNPF